MDALLWIAVGLGAGWAGSKLMLSSGDRLTLGVVAGLVGAVLGGSAMRLLDPAAQAGRVDAVVAAFAGALWLSWLVCVVTFGRLSDDELGARAVSSGPFDRGRNMLGGRVPGAAPLP